VLGDEISSNFIREIIAEDLKQGKNNGRVHTRFPPEPNGFLHIGHAKSICLNFGLAEEFKGLCNLRFDDTNPAKENMEYIEAIQEDIRWLGFDWEDRLYFASDYFEKLYEYALQLIRANKAYVCDLSPEEIRKYRGTLTEAGKESPYRYRTIEENFELFERMRRGEFEEGEKVLRAKIDMSSPNLNLRDPVIYRIIHAPHPRTKDKWCIYPMYDYAHPLSDALEGITHSICTLEFADHRPLYEWFIENVDFSKDVNVPGRPQQIEFARLNLTHIVMSKRKLRQLIEEGYVNGWDDPRLPTLRGLRRRGYTPEAIRNFCDKIGVARRNSTVDIEFLEHCLRENLNQNASRVMVVLKPTKLVLDNYPEDKTEWVESENNPEKPEVGTRRIPFSRELYIEEDDFMENPPPKFYRLAPSREVRLKSAYIIKAENFLKDEKTGKIKKIHALYDPETKSGSSTTRRKVKATIHWVSAFHALPVEVRIYEHLFLSKVPDEKEDFKTDLNPNSLVTLFPSYAEPNLKGAKVGENYQFLREGYFVLDPQSSAERLIFNRSVSLKDEWLNLQKSIKDSAKK